jgi:hypothetical protein
MVNIRIFCDSLNPRLEYAVHELFRYTYNTSKIQFEVCRGDQFSLQSMQKVENDFWISYSRELVPGCDVHFHPCGLLEMGSNAHKDIILEEQDGLPYFFKAPQDFKGEPFDLLAMLFYCLSRIEEYHPDFPKDEYGRCISTGNRLFQEGWSTLPLVDLWKIQFFNRLRDKSIPIELNFPQAFRLTVDVDMIYAYKGRPLTHQMKGVLKDIFRLDFQGIKDRLNVLQGSKKDPFDTYDYIEQCHAKSGGILQFFFHVRDGRGIDLNPFGQSEILTNRIHTIHQKFSVGLHPSRAASQSIDHLRQEVDFISQIIESSIEDSRMHFLLIEWPTTYQNLLKVGIKRDHSLGYHDQVGYRAHTACPFSWYDLQAEKVSSLEIHPFFAMDTTLRKYMGISPVQALDLLTKQREQLAHWQLPFVILWHNSSMSHLMDWKGWEFFLEQLIE